MAFIRAARRRRALEREARQLLRQWVAQRQLHEDPPDQIVRFSALYGRKGWYAPFKTGADEALILSNRTIAVKGGVGYTPHAWLEWKQRPVFIILRPHSDVLSIRGLQIIIAGLRADLTT
jgi:hypothetical protein